MAIQSLNERQRMAVLLSKFEGMSYAEIAETMEMSVQAVKSLLSRARANLQDVLAPYFEDGTTPNPKTKLPKSIPNALPRGFEKKPLPPDAFRC